MKSNPGPALVLWDISQGLTRAEIRAKWQSEKYGAEGIRPRAKDVNLWLKRAGR